MNKFETITVRVISILLFVIGVFAFTGSILLWGEGFLFDFPKGVDFSFPITDILVNMPACIIASIGLWSKKYYGYIASQFVAGFAFYASVEIFVKVAQGDLPKSFGILAPQIFAVILGIVMILYFWKLRNKFLNKE